MGSIRSLFLEIADSFTLSETRLSNFLKVLHFFWFFSVDNNIVNNFTNNGRPAGPAGPGGWFINNFINNFIYDGRPAGPAGPAGWFINKKQ